MKRAREKNENGYFTPDVRSAQNYYPFGMMMPGRSYNAGNYRFGFNGKEKDDEVKGTGNQIDYGMRGYDPRVGRWMGVDFDFNKAPGWTPYRFGFDNPILYSDKEGNFEISPALAQRYPKTALLLQNFDKLYNHQQLPKEVAEQFKGIDFQKIFNDKLVPALKSNSTLSDQQIQEVITPGCGPVVTPMPLDQMLPDLANGLTELDMDKDGNIIPNSNKSDQPGDGKGQLDINDQVLDVVEFELGGKAESGMGGKMQTSIDKDKSVRVFLKTVLHETVHFGRNKSGAGNKGGVGSIDYGTKMEKDCYGSKEGRLKKGDMTNSGSNDK